MPRRPISRRDIANTSLFATRVARRSRRANTSGSVVAGVAFISRQIALAASSDATSPPSTPPMPSHTTISTPRSAAARHVSATSTSVPASRSPTT
jgi:hypothetical protein